MDIGDKVQHFGTGSIGTVIDSSYEVETPFQQLLKAFTPWLYAPGASYWPWNTPFSQTRVLPVIASAALRSGALLCDAMGYQEPVDPAAEQAAQQLVEEELRQNPGAPPRLPALRPPRDSSIMAAEFSRCDRDEDLAPLAIERYSCAPPTEQDPEAWKSARTHVRAQLEHQANRVVNLELAESFSEHTWRRHVHDLGRLHAQVAALAEGKEREAEQINLKRKRDQAKLGPDIVRAERAVVERLERHRALEARVAALRKEGE